MGVLYLIPLLITYLSFLVRVWICRWLVRRKQKIGIRKREGSEEKDHYVDSNGGIWRRLCTKLGISHMRRMINSKIQCNLLISNAA